MLVATWTAEAWEEVCRDHHVMIRQAFVETGFLVAKDGSENGLIKLEATRRGVTPVPYTF
jgi:UDP-N-acetylglucosamine transferase subunit ALG13